MTDAAVPARLSRLEKFGYGLGDAASNMVFQTVLNFLAFYYTDIVELTPATVGAIFLIVRIFDAVIDPVMGAVADRTRTRWGRFRPWLLLAAPGLALSAVFTFAVPDLPGQGTMLFALFSYALLMVFYTAVNIPYGALAAVMTTDPVERTQLQSWRFALAMLGTLIVTAGTLPLVEWLGQGDRHQGYLRVMVLFGVLATAMLVVTFLTTKERVPVATQEHHPLLADLKALWRNDQWRVLAGINFLLLVAVVMRGGLAIYFVTYVLDAPQLTTGFLALGTVGGVLGSILAGRMAAGFTLRGVGGLALVQLGLIALLFALGLIDGPLAIAGTLGVVAGVAIGWVMAIRLERTRALAALLLLQGVGHLLILVAGNQSAWLSTLLFVLTMMLNQTAVPLLWALMADSVDYGRWKTGRYIPGLNFSAVLFALKMGVAVGGALSAWLLGAFGYLPNQPQTSLAMTGILLSFTVVPAVFLLAAAILALGTRLTLTFMKDLKSSR